MNIQTDISSGHIAWIRVFQEYSRTPLKRPPSESHWCGRIRGMVAREGFVYEQKPLSVTRNVVVWEGWSLVRVVVRQGFCCTMFSRRACFVIKKKIKKNHQYIFNDCHYTITQVNIIHKTKISVWLHHLQLNILLVFAAFQNTMMQAKIIQLKAAVLFIEMK